MLEIKYDNEAASDIGWLVTSEVVILSFILSTLIAYIYVWTMQRERYSRNYIQAIVLIAIIASVIILSVGDNLARGIGIIAAVNIIRFRTNFKNPRDTVFLFAALTAGIACGAKAFIVATEGTLCFGAAAVLLRYFPFSPATFYDGELSIKAKAGTANIEQINVVIANHCVKYTLVEMEENKEKETVELAYNFKMNHVSSQKQLIQALNKQTIVLGVKTLTG